MVQYRHNEPYYKLQLSELDEDVVRVLAFEGKEQISRLFQYKLELLSEDAELDPADILNKKATLLIMRGDEDPLPVHGIISHFEQRGRTPDYVSYYAELVPKMWRLDLNFQSRVFQNMNIEQMITEVLEGAELTSEDFEFKLNETYPDIEFAVQYRETDFNYVNRRLEHYGIYYYFEHRDDNDVIVFNDANENLPVVETEEAIAYNPNKDPLSEQETISRLIYQGQVVTGKTQLKDYNYQTPSKELIAESQINSDNPGSHSDYGDRFSDEGEGEFQVRIRDEAMVSKGTVYKGNGDCRLFHAGYIFTMTEHYREDWNQEFLLTKLILRGNQRSLFGTFPPESKVPPTYENYFESMPVEISYRPQRVSMQPKITGVLNAKVDAAGDGSQAEIDDQGRYKVILPFDLSGNSGGEASCFIRMIQPYTGPNYGMHFPLHKDTEVLLTFVDGNPDLPVISGAVPNPETISPIRNTNQTKSVIRDNYGNEIMMDATPGDEHIRLYSPHHKSKLTIGRSVCSITDSVSEDIWLGHKFEFGAGASEEIFAGSKLELGTGTTTDVKLGSTDFELFVGSKFSAGYGVECEYVHMPKIEKSQKDISTEAAKDQMISAGDGVCIIGGKASVDEERCGIINADENQLVLSFGNTTQQMESSVEWKRAIPIVLAVIGGVVTHAIGWASGEIPRHVCGVGEADDVGYQPSQGEYDDAVEAKTTAETEIAIGGGISGAAWGAILSALTIGFTIFSEKIFFKDEAIEPFYHDPADDEDNDLRWVGIDNEGIILSVNPKDLKDGGEGTSKFKYLEHDSEMDSRISLNEDGGIYINTYEGKKKEIELAVVDGDEDCSSILMDEEVLTIQAGDSSISINVDGEIKIRAKQNKFTLFSDNEITIDSKTEINLQAPQVNCCDGSFKSKSIESY